MQEIEACVHIDAMDVIAPIDPRLYSSFIEHMGRAVYTGIYEPAHPTADEQGFRQDVMALIKPLALPLIRYPGGNFLSGYRWEDGIGDKAARPARPDLAWSAIEPNQVGTDEFMDYCRKLGAMPMMGVNLGTGTPQDAVNLLEYCNGELPTHYAELRRRNGHPAPYKIKTWCLGNEMDGPWQICGMDAEEYGRIACKTARMMKWFDPSIELVACGSSFRDMPSFGAWERTVLSHCYTDIDYLSLHQYYQNKDGDIPSFLARNMEMDGFINEVAAICREIKRQKNTDHDVYLSFDEWNVWYHYQQEGKDAPKWIVGRAIEEERYNVADALLVGGMLQTLMRNADTVKIACLAQLVNALAAIMTEPNGRAWAQTIYYPFLLASRYGRGVSLRCDVAVPTYSCAVADQTPYLDAAPVLSSDGTLSLFLLNRSVDTPLHCTVALDGFTPARVLEHVGLYAHALTDCNTADASPVVPRTLSGALLHENTVAATLPAASWSVLRLGAAR